MINLHESMGPGWDRTCDPWICSQPGYLYVLHSSPIVILLTCSIPDISMYFLSEMKTVWILIRWLHQKPSDLDLHCFQNKINSGSAGHWLITDIFYISAISLTSITLMALPHDFTHYLNFIKSLELGSYALGPALIIAAKYILAFPVSYHYINGMRHLVSIPIMRISRGWGRDPDPPPRPLRNKSGYKNLCFPRNTGSDSLKNCFSREVHTALCGIG